MIRIAVVEDEELFRLQLERYLNRYKTEHHETFAIRYFSDGTEIVENYTAEYDIILLDIQMSLMNGMQAAEEIRMVDKDVVIMFITNMTQYAIRGYQVDALDYIVKPVEYFSFSQKLGRAIDRVVKKPVRYMTLQKAGNVMKVKISDIRYVESHGHTLCYFLNKDGVVENRGVMKELEEELLGEGFFRCNKGCIVNLAYVDGIQDNNCVIGEELLPISRGKRKEFLEVLVDYMSRMGK